MQQNTNVGGKRRQTNPRRLQWQEDETRSEKRGQIDGLADLGMLG